jgi:hypothetical protein
MYNDTYAYDDRILQVYNSIAVLFYLPTECHMKRRAGWLTYLTMNASLP